MKFNYLFVLFFLLRLSPAGTQNILQQKLTPDECDTSSKKDSIPLFFLVSGKQKNDLACREKEASFYQISEEQLSDIFNNGPQEISTSIFIEDEKINIRFNRTDVLANNATIRTSDGTTRVWDHSIKTYSAILEHNKGWASLTVSKNEAYVVITSSKGNFEIGPLERNIYIGKYAKMKEGPFIDPEMEGNVALDETKTNPGVNRYGNCLEVFVEVDFFTYNALGATLPAVNLWITRLFNNVQAVYNLHGVPIIVSDILIWQNTDPYAAATSLSTMNQTFVNTRRNDYNGRIATLLSTRNLGGGLAHGIGGFCNSYPAFPGPFCTNTSLLTNNVNFPAYSFNTYLVCHEIGHIMGLRHTHACVWNGNYTQVDDCGNVYAQQNNTTIEGSDCYNPNNPILNTGTIMSHCHLLPGGGIDLSLGFGPVVGARLYDNYTFASCLTGTVCNNQPPVNDLCSGAITLPVTRNCSLSTFTNSFATASGATPGFSCGVTGQTFDVWFKVQVPASGSLTMETGQVSGGLTDLIMQVYSGTCNALVQIECDDNDGAGNHALVSLSGRTPGEILFVRVIESRSDETGIFGICVHDISLPCHPDFTTLINFYNATNGPSWTNRAGWQNGAAGNDCNVCNWYGVTCNDDDRVMELRLSNNNLTATSLPSSLTNLSLLKVLVLYDNNLSGSIPTWFHNFPHIETIDLGSNNFSGTLPANLGIISGLESLYLDDNNLTGTLLPSLGNLPLSLIYLNNNNFTGCFPNSYENFCDNSYNFTLNANLPGMGNFSAFCVDSTGGDFDMDGFCKGPNDCIDTDATIYLGASEFCDNKDNDCDGMVDDGAPVFTNVWIGGSGNWNISSNWSLGFLPAKCTHVIINTNVTVTVPAHYRALAKSVNVINGANLVVITGGILDSN
ncbi:MAG: hypothetical protein IPI53_08970 [Saprospiraceae bacterium]|nr:hypothetical protein [Saprospiraceae bacterium]